MRQTLLVALALVSFACAGDDSLAVTGEVQVTADGTSTGFAFDRRTNLLDPDLAAPDDTRLRGRCVIGRDDVGEDVVAFAIERSPTSSSGIQIDRLSVRATRDGAGDVEVELGGTTHTASASGTCDIALPYAVRSDGIASVEIDCTVSDATGATAQVTADLSYEGCDVE